MKKKIILTTILIIALMVIVSSLLTLTKTVYIFNFSETNNIHFYEKAVNYIRENNDDYHYQNEEDYCLFTSYHGFGSYSDVNYTYVFLWITEECYYTKNGELYSGSGSNMPYKFTFKNNEVVRCEIPKDGDEYAFSIKKWFPKYMRHLYPVFLNYDNQLSEDIEKQVNEHYSYLK